MSNRIPAFIFILLTAAPLAHAGMGMGMGGSQQQNDNPGDKAIPSPTKVFLNYLHDQHLRCQQCHAVSAGGFGPSFVSISNSYAHNNNAINILSIRIEQGTGRMPGGLATKTQAEQLAHLILELTEARVSN